MLQLASVTKTYGGSAAVNGVTLRIPAGQFVGIIGSSGAGKSTLLRLVNRLVDPSGGSIAFGDMDVGALKGAALRQWRARCAMVFQHFNLTTRLDVLTNVLIGRAAGNGTLSTLFKRFSAADRMLAAQALERLGMLAHALQPAGTLSGGQQQRVAIARALAQQPEIILADEPIAALDPVNAQLVMDALRGINRADGITVICNLHTLNAARSYSDRIIGLSAGRVVFDGPPEALTDDALRMIYGQSEHPAVDERITAGHFPARQPVMHGMKPVAAN
jgi:phosphonate transport system ATP-binding protein